MFVMLFTAPQPNTFPLTLCQLSLSNYFIEMSRKTIYKLKIKHNINFRNDFFFARQGEDDAPRGDLGRS